MILKKLRWLGISLSLMVGMSSCASVMSGPNQKISLESTPSGANVKIVNRDGDQVANVTTPTTVSLRRGAGYFRAARYVATFEKEGYMTEKVPIVNDGVGNWWTMGNLLIGGLIGILIIDPATGAMYVLDPDEINQTLTPIKKG